MYSAKECCAATLLLLIAVISTGCAGGGGGNTVTTVGGNDTAPPVISNPQPSGIQQANTTSVSMRVTTNESATCKYSTSNSVYANMPNTFTTTNSTVHSQTISGLQNGQTYTYYVRCQDTNRNVNTSSTLVIWSVAMPGSTGTATLTWGASPVDANHGTPDGYRIYHAASSGGTYVYFAQPGNVLTYTANNLSSGAHCFAVTAYNSGGESDYAACSSGNCCKTIP